MIRPIRVAYLALSDQTGGAERQMLALAARLPRERFMPELIVRSGAGSSVEPAKRAGIPVRSMRPARPAAGGPATGIRSRVSSSLALLRILRRGHYDLVDAWLYPADVAAALARPLVSRPLVFSGRRNLDPRDRFGRLERVVEGVANRWTDTVVANSAAAAAHAVATQGVDPDRVRIIRNGVEIPAPIAADERDARRRELGVDRDDVVVGCVANYTPIKRLDRLVDAFAVVARDTPNVRLELIGEGPGRADLEAQVGALGLTDRVCVHGFEPAPERLYPAFDIVALSSEREGLPNALLEAGAAGRAIVSTAAGGATEIVIDGRTGLLVPIDDADAFAHALGRLVREPELRERLGAAVLPHVEQTFGMDRFVAEFGSLYEERLAARRRGAGPDIAIGT